MKPFLIIATINELNNLKGLTEEFKATGTHIVVVDEGNAAVRGRNSRILGGIPVDYYGPAERIAWFKERFGEDYERYLSVIPERAHAETSFGFLIALEQGADFVVELDDDVFISSLITGHREGLFDEGGVTVSSPSRWYNSLDVITMNSPGRFFPRGHPYSCAQRAEKYAWRSSGGRCVVNMGHWIGNPDFDALTILYNGGLDGRCGVKGLSLNREKVIVDKGTYFAVCSMNTSFVPKVIPAFYQLYMNVMGVDRFDDIWSGIFVKRVADHLGDKVCLGKPAGTHDKRPRSVFKDLRKEMDGMILNETVWQMIDGDLTGKTYADAYLSMTNLLEKGMRTIADETYRKFMALQVEKMRLWVDVVDKI
ncbi:MAG TPA: hypothetical protein PKX17_04085 [Candidatus Methanomethylicus sp.]|nr:hypothetical protein [Candidatus Methanomethylicus sp.]